MESTNRRDKDPKLPADLSAAMAIGEAAVSNPNSTASSELLMSRIDAARKGEFEAKIASLQPELLAFDENWHQTDREIENFKTDRSIIDKAKAFIVESDIEILASEGQMFKTEFLKPYSGSKDYRSIRPALKLSSANIIHSTVRIQDTIAKYQSWCRVYNPHGDTGEADWIIARLNHNGEQLGNEGTRSGNIGYELYLEALKLRQRLVGSYSTAYNSALSVMNYAHNIFTESPDSAGRLLDYLQQQSNAKTQSKDGKILGKLLSYEHTLRGNNSVVQIAANTVAEAYRQSSFTDFYRAKVESDDYYKFINLLLDRQTEDRQAGSSVEAMREMEAAWTPQIHSDYRAYISRNHQKLHLKVANTLASFNASKLNPPSVEELAELNK